MVRRRQRRGAGVSRTRASEGESNSIKMEGRKPIWVSKGLIKKHFVWDLEIETNVREAWDSKASSRYTDFLRGTRDKNVKLVCMSDDAWRNFTSYWGTPKNLYKSVHLRDFELFPHTQTSGRDKKTFINEKSKTTNDNVLHLRKEMEENPASAKSQVDETKLHIAATSDAKKRNLYGVRSKRADYIIDSGNEGG
nr:hypothetical protein [Tanacetum cinerariifolium]